MTVEEFEALMEGKKYKPKKEPKPVLTNRDLYNFYPEDQVFCFTGTLSSPRNVLEEEAKSAGAEVRSVMSKNVTFLVAQNVNGRSEKLKQARALNIHIINEDQFWTIIGN